MSNHTSLNDARLDRAIERAVRDMMQVDPAPGLRRRVLSRINAPAERRALPAMRYAFATAALVVLVLSITLMPGPVEPPTPPKPPSLIVSIPLRSLEGSVPPIDLGVPARETPTRITKERISMPRVTNVFGNHPSGVSAATVREPEALRVAPESLAPLTIVPLSAHPILIEPLVLQGVPKQIPYR